VTQPSNDVVIVGGGPAGLYTGLQLARAGCRVELFEEHAQIGQPVHCTGVLAQDAFGEFDLPSDSVLNHLTTVRFVAPSGTTVEYATPSVEAVVIDRGRFDRELADQATRAGLRITRGRVTAVQARHDGVQVAAGDVTARARACVLACGAGYALHRRLGLGMPRLMLHTAQAEVAAARLHPVEVHFGEATAPGGFAWAVPVERAHGSYVRVGVMCDGQAALRFRHLLARLSQRWGIDSADAGRVPRQKILPLAPLRRTYGDRLLAVGDAAGIVKPTTGGGIYYSLLTARLAAQTLIPALNANRLEAPALSDYERAWRSALGSELRWQIVLRRIARRLSDRDIDGLFDLAHTDGIMPIVRRTARFNSHRQFIVALLKHPPARRVLFRAAFA
jgi:geranylgeranyl reductase family protein